MLKFKQTLFLLDLHLLLSISLFLLGYLWVIDFSFTHWDILRQMGLIYAILFILYLIIGFLWARFSQHPQIKTASFVLTLILLAVYAYGVYSQNNLFYFMAYYPFGYLLRNIQSDYQYLPILYGLAALIPLISLNLGFTIGKVFRPKA
ncbi:MAG: hypothetical protein WCI62_04685 [Erysipelotrichaceae bacterium]